MDAQEVKVQSDRIEKYRRLELMREKVYAAIRAVTEDQKDGPCGQGPFTGNTRESRQIISMHIKFSATRGTSPPVDMFLDDLHIEAWELGRELERMLRAKLKTIQEAMDKI